LKPGVVGIKIFEWVLFLVLGTGSAFDGIASPK
jgi:hypothetical protein